MGVFTVYGVLIAEDELLVRLGIQNSINWSKYDMQVVGSAQDGQIAWDIFQEKKPEIVITDLKMPVLDGMELISRIRGRGASTKIVILTCVEEFETARKAISLGVQNYIPKLTMSVGDIETVLDKLKGQLDKESDHEPAVPQVGEDIVKERLLKGFLFHELFTKEQFCENVKKYKLRLTQKALLLCIMEIDHSDRLKNPDQGQNSNENAVIPSITNIANNLLVSLPTGEVFYNDHGQYIIITNLGDGAAGIAAVKEICEKIGETVKMYFGFSVIFSCSGTYDDYAKLPQMYREATRTMGKKYYLGEAGFLDESMDIEKPYFQKIGETIERISTGKSMAIFRSEQYENIERALNAAVLSPDQVTHLLCQLLQWISYTMMTCFAMDLSETSAIYMHQLENCETLDDCITAINAFCNKLEDVLLSKDAFSYNISKAIRYIQSNYNNELTLGEVAKFVNMSPGYFSSAFKKETKHSFIEYLNLARVERAKKLLLGTEFKSYEIADKVGFSDNTYFCKVFKKVSGISPIEYREKQSDLSGEGSHEIS